MCECNNSSFMQHRAYICEARILHTVDGPMSKGGKVCHFPFIIKIGNVTKKYTSCSHEKVQYNPTLGLKPNFHSFPVMSNNNQLDFNIWLTIIGKHVGGFWMVVQHSHRGALVCYNRWGWWHNRQRLCSLSGWEKTYFWPKRSWNILPISFWIQWSQVSKKSVNEGNRYDLQKLA